MKLNRPSVGQMFAITLGLLFVGVLVSAYRLRQASSSYTVALDNLQECRGLATKIRELQDQPSRAQLSPESAAQISQRVQAAAEAARLPSSIIAAIDPQSPTTLAQSNYRVQTTRIAFNSLTLTQLVTILSSLDGAGDALVVNFIDLAPAKPSGATTPTAEQWLPSASVSGLIFEPLKQ